MDEDIRTDAVPHETLRTTSMACTVHMVHKPRSHQNHIHHVWPRGLGGPDIPENKVITCPTGHGNIHMLLKEWIKADGDPGVKVSREYTKGEQQYAELGFRRYKAKDMLLDTTPLN